MKTVEKLIGVITVIIMILTVLAVGVSAAVSDFISKESFEYADMQAANENGWFASGVSEGTTVELSGEKARTGLGSLKIVTNGGNERFTRDFNVEYGRSYKIEAWVYVTEGFVASVGNSGLPQARIFLRENINGGTSYGYKAVNYADTEWQRLSLLFSPLEGQTNVNVWLNMGGAVGTVYFDDFSFTEINGAYLDNGDFESTALEGTYKWADGWSIGTGTKGTNAYASSSEKYSGKYSMACPVSATTVSKVYKNVPGLEAGAYYTIRAKIKFAYDTTKAGTLSPVTEGIRFLFTPNINASVSSTDHWMFGSSGQVFNTENAWQQVVYNVQLPSTYSGSAAYIGFTTGKLRAGWENAGVVVYVDDVTVSKLQNNAAFFKTDGTLATGIESSLVVKGAFVGDKSNTTAVALIAMYKESGGSFSLADIKLVNLAGYEAPGSVTKYANFNGVQNAYSIVEFTNLNQAITVPEDCTAIKVLMLNNMVDLLPFSMARTLK